MKAMQLTGIRQMQMQHVAEPTLQNDTDVRVQMKAVGVCGSDIHYYVFGQIGSQVVQYPFTVGHEGAGQVVEVGPGVTSVRPGDRVIVEPAIHCGTCDQCRIGRPHTCRKISFLGCPGQAEGCLSDYVVMPERNCLNISDDLTFQEAALTEPLAIGVYGVQQSIPMNDATIGILGVGPIGLSVLMPARAMGIKKAYVTDKLDARLAIAQAVGADWGGNPDTGDIVGDILAVEPGGLDVVFECCGQQDALDQAIALLKPGGTLMVIGIPQDKRVSFPVDDIRRKEICIRNVRRQNDCVQRSVEMILEKRFDVNRMVTHHFNFDQAAEAFDVVADYRDGVMKAMIHFD